MAKETVAEIKREGLSIVLPEGMTYDTAIDNLQKRKVYEETETQVIEEVKAFVWDGALALQKAIKQMFGWSENKSIASMFGSTPPTMLPIETGVDKTELVPWGRFKLPGIEGYIETSGTNKNGMSIFVLSARIKRKDIQKIRDLVELTRKFVKEESIYKGKAIRIPFYTEDGGHNNSPYPVFIDTTKINADEIVFSEDVRSSIEGNLFTLIRHKDLCKKYKIPLKRGVLLSGKYGTGKTLVANQTALECEQHGWTFLMCERADELKDMLAFARQYQPAVVFCEDVDRATSGDERTVEIDDILNIIDGIESKGTEIMVVLTTNHAENIIKAMLRPGRLDAVINVLPPDSEAVQKLIRIYGRGLVDDTQDLTLVGEKLSGKIPAVIRECIERAKLYAISEGHLNGKSILITSDNLICSVESMQNQLSLLEADNKKEGSAEEVLGQKFAEIMDKKLSEKTYELSDAIQDVRDNL